MQIYRATKPLTTGQRAGDIVLETDLRAEAVAVLIGRGTLAAVSMPPLRELPGWKARGRMLAEIGVETIPDLLDTNEEDIIRKFNLRRRSTVEKWRREALSWLDAPAKRSCGRC